VGASFAVLVAEEMFASGCDLLISITSSGQINPRGATPYFILIDRALRDEGTSYHYLPASDWSLAQGPLLEALAGDFEKGEANGTADALEVLARSVPALSDDPRGSDPRGELSRGTW
jgi:uridine phosphorylase